ncbi:MAG: hypothetical protein Q8L46_00055, partial [candidate division WWE3 bacterium]|nr:hypothetical protein [candidate division WWE3 bacterium]
QFNLVAVFFITVGLVAGTYFTLTEAIPRIFALNDTAKTWTFNTANAGSYTYDDTLVTVDDSGGRPVTGVNKITNPAFVSGNSSWSVAAVPPSGWVEVPGSSTYSTSNFLAMKYESKCAATPDPATGLTSPATAYNTYDNATTACTSGNSRQVVSVASGYPIANISHDTAKTYCTGVTLNGNATHLITNPEWMTVARNAEAQAGNWTGVSVGSGYLFAGHNDNVPALARVASTTDTGNYRCAYTDGAPGTEAPSTCPTNTANGQSGTAGNQVRTLSLSNGAVIWDIAGNVWDHVQVDASDTKVSQQEQPEATTDGTNPITDTAYTWSDFTGSGSTRRLLNNGTEPPFGYNVIRPLSSSYDASYGVGRILHWSNSSSSTKDRVFLRGGSWGNASYAGAFTLSLNWDSSVAHVAVGFRCASDPVAISQSWSSSSGRAGGGDTVTIGSISDGKIYQSINVGNTSTYDFSVYVYDNTTGNVGGTVSSSIAQLYYHGSTISTTYTDAGSGWWRLS